MKHDLVIAAMSGGVDSSVAAAILKEKGHNVVGITMRVWEDPSGQEAREGTCCSLDDVNDARRVAETLGIPHYTLNVKERFKEQVVDYFVAEYMVGRTPNPCALCNQSLKFDYLFEQGAKFNAQRVATGHYASIAEFEGYSVVKRGIDPVKDQSYFLFSINPSRMDKILFPIGEIEKEEVRALAKKFSLNVAEKPESQEICFIPDNDYKSFLQDMPEGQKITTGDIVDEKGNAIGRHNGYPFYTIGQRKGLGGGSADPLYVSRIEPETNRIVAGPKQSLYSSALSAIRMNWYVPPENLDGLDLTVRIRHQHKDAPAALSSVSGGGAVIEFEQPQLSVTPGQAVVIYHGDYVMGGGWIEKRLD